MTIWYRASPRYVCAVLMLLAANACSVLVADDVQRIGGYRFEVFHADRYTSASYDRIEIGFRLHEDGADRPKHPFDQAFAGKMRVVDGAGRSFPVLVQATRPAGGSAYVPWHGYLGIVKLGGRNAATAGTPLEDFRLVIESPDPSERGEHIELPLRF